MTVEREAGPAGKSFSGSLRLRGTGTWVYVSGKLGTDESGAVVTGGLRGQARAALDQVLSSVAEAGGGPEHVVKLTAYLTSLVDYDSYNEVRREVFGSTLPASTAIGIAELILDGAVIEIDGVAFVPDGE
jgi:enamine deaminase RidA (YjgF/YER057c/UK114 family)